MNNKWVYYAVLVLISLLAACSQPRPTPDRLQPTLTQPKPTNLPLTTTEDWNTESVIDRRKIGSYEIILWGPASSVDLGFAMGYGRFTIERNGETLMTIDEAHYFLDSPAADLTGEGNPDILLGLRNGGSHCCWGTVLVDLSPEPVEILRIWSSIQGDWGMGKFVDLDGDSAYELITADAIEAPCTTPTVKVILQYQPDIGFHPVSPNFPELYAEDIEAGLNYIERDSDPENRCSIPSLAAAYYFSGRPAEARQIFDQYYTANDAESYWLELESGFKNARFYTD